MTKHLSIRNYKSIKDLDIDLKRVNIFIGEHNSGKSNILEALTWFSVNALNKDLFPEIFRFKTATDLFYDFDVTKPIEIKTDNLTADIRYAKNTNGALLNYFSGLIYTNNFLTESDNNTIGNGKNFSNILGKYPNSQTFNLQYSGEIVNSNGSFDTVFRTYIFKRLKAFQSGYLPFLNPPFGDNIPSLLMSNKEYKELISSFFKEKGFRLMLKPSENEIMMAKDINDELYSFPYQTISETMQRFVFLLLAIVSNQNASLILDEPESNMFPFFVKDFAERIAYDQTNQYFITTHNPYLLSSLLEKTPLEEVSVFVTRMINYKTNVNLCNAEQINEIVSMGSGAFFNLENIFA